METAFQKLIDFLKDVGTNYVTDQVMSKIINTDFNPSMTLPTDLEEVEQILQSENPTLYSEYCEFKRFIQLTEDLANDSEVNVLIKITDFALLSTVLVHSPLKHRERAQVMLKLLEKNIGFVEEYVEYLEIHNQFAELHNTLVQEQQKQNSLITKIKQVMNPEFFDAIELIENNNMKEMNRLNQILKEHYFDKLDSYDTNDVETFINALVEMKLEPSVCDAIKSVMTKNLDKRNKDNIVYVTPVKEMKVVEEVKLTQKEYKTIYHEINTKYFNLDEMKAIRVLSLDEIIFCTSLFLQLGMNNNQIDNVIRIMEKENKKSKTDTFTQYHEVSQKLEYYGRNESLSQYIDVLATTSKEDADYQWWLMEMGKELDNILVELQDNHEYEIEEANKLLQIKMSSQKTL